MLAFDAAPAGLKPAPRAGLPLVDMIGRAVSPLRRLHFGIAAKIALWAALIGVPVVAIVAVFVYTGSVDILVDRQQQNLAHSVDLAAARITTRFDTAERDASFLLATPTLLSLQRAAGNDGVDPLDGSTQAALLDRAATLFTALLNARSSYFGVRFVGPTGKEMVRVDRPLGGSVVRASDADLSQSDPRPYFIDAANFQPGHVYVSGFELNRANGVIQTPSRPTAHVAAPLFDSAGAFSGTVVLDLELQGLFDLVSQTIGPSAQSFVATSAGDYVANPDATRTFGFESGNSYRLQDDYPELAALVGGDGADFTGVVSRPSGTYLASGRRVAYDPANPSSYVVLAALTSNDEVVARARSLRDMTALIAGIFILIGVVCAVLLARLIVRPLRAVTAVASEIASGRRDVDISRFTGRSDETGELARAIAAMVTEVNEREGKLQAQADELTRSNQELAQFAYVASHDLQEPLRMVGSYLELLARRYEGKLDDEAQEFIGFAVDGATRMKRLINDLLGYSRAGSSPLKLEAVDTRQLVETVLASLALQIDDTGAEVRVGLLPTVRADPVQFGRVFQNLIENAIKYRRADGTPLVTVDAVRTDSGWRFAIADNGIGIDPVFKDKIFEIFKRLHGRERYSGTGIGLAVTKLVVERHGGRVWVEPRTGGGSVFYFTLPEARTA